VLLRVAEFGGYMEPRTRPMHISELVETLIDNIRSEFSAWYSENSLSKALSRLASNAMEGASSCKL
jgi:hypothetical protein